MLFCRRHKISLSLSFSRSLSHTHTHTANSVHVPVATPKGRHGYAQFASIPLINWINIIFLTRNHAPRVISNHISPHQFISPGTAADR